MKRATVSPYVQDDMLVLRVERKGASGATVREEEFGGAEGSRTPDPHNAMESWVVVMGGILLAEVFFSSHETQPKGFSHTRCSTPFGKTC